MYVCYLALHFGTSFKAMFYVVNVENWVLLLYLKIFDIYKTALIFEGPRKVQNAIVQKFVDMTHFYRTIYC